jgi:cell wall-associated NlpC family hydrolase
MGIIFLLLTNNVAYADTIYTIKKGDSLYKISKKFGVSVEEIKTKNKIATSRIKLGKKIIVPTSTHPQTIEKAEATHDTQYHIVKKGDTLSAISKKYSIPLSELREINNLGSTKIKPGQKLLVKRIGPKTYTVRKGDSIYKIARKFNIDADELRDINLLETDLLKPGQKLLLEPEVEDEPKTSEPILSEAQIEEEVNGIPESEEISIKERLILFAKKLLDIPYRFGGSSLLGIDCSAYVQKVYSFLGIELPRSAREQFNVGESIEKDDLSIGDLVFFRTYASFPSHVGIYLGNNLFIHASSKDKKVTIDSLLTPYYLKRFIGAKRILEKEDEKKEEPQKEG